MRKVRAAWFRSPLKEKVNDENGEDSRDCLISRVGKWADLHP